MKLTAYYPAVLVLAVVVSGAAQGASRVSDDNLPAAPTWKEDWQVKGSGPVFNRGNSQKYLKLPRKRSSSPSKTSAPVQASEQDAQSAYSTVDRLIERAPQPSVQLQLPDVSTQVRSARSSSDSRDLNTSNTEKVSVNERSSDKPVTETRVVDQRPDKNKEAKVIVLPPPKRDDSPVTDDEQFPEPAVTYRPKLPPIGRYSVKNVCEPIHSSAAASVTLNSGETLRSAYERLALASNRKGGIINVPWYTDTVQCDSLWKRNNGTLETGVTIRGLPGPNGQQPRFYCRRDVRDGTIPKEFMPTSFLSIGAAPGPTSLMVENLHIDGYSVAVNLPEAGRIVLRNNYIHHQYGNAIGNSDTSEPGIQQSIEICGNEIAHAGRWNIEHGLYLHRSLVPESSIEVTFVDNVCHSALDSSCYKSIANKNTLINNKFYHSLDTDPSYTKTYGTILADIAACAENHLQGNEFHGHKVKPRDGDIMIGIRNRRSIRGCDMPDYNSQEFWNPLYWSSLNKQKIFPTRIEDNKFFAGPDYGDRLFAITAMGTYPNDALDKFSPFSVLLDTPGGWYERSRVYASGNSYEGFATDHLYREWPPEHCTVDGCGPAPSNQPDSDLIEVGSGETSVP